MATRRDHPVGGDRLIPGVAGRGHVGPGEPGDGVRVLLQVLDRPSPATDVRMMLSLYRRRGYAFEQAWSRALRTLPHVVPDIEEWCTLLRRNKHVWKAAYEQGS